nr:TrkA family potassium uptake protein [Pseudoclavibacter sp. Marseille-Q3772]
MSETVCVIGLGRFGTAVATELMKDGVEVLGIDPDDDVVQALDGLITHVVRGDATHEPTLRKLSVPEFETAVVAIGGSIEASILVTGLLQKFKVPNIWAKAVSEQHAEILTQLGVKHVVKPETDMGRRTAHLLRGRLEEYVEIADDFVITQQLAPEFALGTPIGDLRLRRNYGVHVTGVRHPGGTWQIALPEVALQRGDHILVAGNRRDADNFARLPCTDDLDG